MHATEKKVSGEERDTISANTMTEAQTLDAVFRNLTKLGQSATKQMREEDGDDPLSNVTLAELREYAAGINSTIKKLEDEDTFFSGESELGQEPDNELGAMLAAAREGSRKLAIALSASKFGDSVHTTLRSIENFCRPELLHDLAVAKVSDLLELTSKPVSNVDAAAAVCPTCMAHWSGNPASYHVQLERGNWPKQCPNCGQDHSALGGDIATYAIRHVPCPQYAGNTCVVAGSVWPRYCTQCRQNHSGCPLEPLKRLGPEPTLDLAKIEPGVDGKDSAKKLKTICAAAAEQLERLEAACETNSIEKEQKATLAGEIQSNVDSKVIPGLKKHVLRVGVGKGLIDTAKLGDLLQQSEYPLIEQVHCELEHCRDLIVEEKTVRKMEKRILEQQDSASTRWVEVSHSN